MKFSRHDPLSRSSNIVNKPGKRKFSSWQQNRNISCFKSNKLILQLPAYVDFRERMVRM
jgi:hypothetical protein